MKGLAPKENYSIHESGKSVLGRSQSKEEVQRVMHKGAAGHGFEHPTGIPGDVSQSQWVRSRSKDSQKQSSGYEKVIRVGSKVFERSDSKTYDMDYRREQMRLQNSGPATRYHLQRSNSKDLALGNVIAGTISRSQSKEMIEGRHAEVKIKKLDNIEVQGSGWEESSKNAKDLGHASMASVVKSSKKSANQEHAESKWNRTSSKG